MKDSAIRHATEGRAVASALIRARNLPSGTLVRVLESPTPIALDRPFLVEVLAEYNKSFGSWERHVATFQSTRREGVKGAIRLP